MPFSDLARVAVLSNLGTDWELLTEQADCPDIGWDTLTCTFIKDYGSTIRSSNEIAAEWPIGRRPIPFKDFWTVARTPKRLGGNVWTLEVIARGSTATRPLKHRVAAASQVFRREGGLAAIKVLLPGAPAPTDVAAANIRQSDPVLEFSYISIGAPVDTTRIGKFGTAEIPPVNIPARPPLTLFQRIGTAVEINWPRGWVLDTLDADVLAGTDIPASLVTETWIHQQTLADT